VRRRASLLALSLRGNSALELGETAIRDPHPDVRSLAALVLGASGVESARTWLMQAMRDPEVRVRKSASQALSRLLGQDVSQLVNLDEAQRRREVRRLSQVPSNPVKAKLVAALPVAGASVDLGRQHHASSLARSMVAGPGEATGVAFARTVLASAGDTRAALSPREPEPQVIEVAHVGETVVARSPREDRGGRLVDAAEAASRFTSEHAEPGSADHLGAPAPHTLRDEGPSVAHAPVRLTEPRSTASGALSHLTTGSRVAVVEVEVAPAVDATLLDGVLTELRAAIRGQSVDALATSLHATVDGVRAACAELMSQGQVVRRGLKYFVA
jgi:hypothetical protein